MFLAAGFPFSAGAVAPALLVLGGGGIVGITGFSIYRNMAPVNINDAMNFFSSCWSCQVFSSIMSAMSNILPNVYSSIGVFIISFAVITTAVWYAWKLLNGFYSGSVDSPASLGNLFTTHLVKLAFISILMAAPLPRLVTSIAIEPVFNVGLAMNRMLVGDDTFDACVVATALADDGVANPNHATTGAYSPKLRHNLMCQVAVVHQMTAMGMTVGWTMWNMAFNDKYKHKILWDIPIFPNVPMFFGGLLVMVLFLIALLPVPVYFLEIFIKLSMDLIMLPLMLLSWLFKDWKIFPQSGAKSILTIINDVVTGTVGIALIGVFVTFATMFLNAIFGNWRGATRLSQALAQNDSTILMDGLLLRDDSIIVILMMGIFLAMFMTMIPALIKTLFRVQISTEFYQDMKNNANTIWQGLKKAYAAIKK